MALITRCPNCGTAFRITPIHLQAHGGDVRCGRCTRIFNGFSALATMQEPESAVPATAEGVDTTPVETLSDASEAAPEAPAIDSDTIPEPRIEAAPGVASEAAPEPDPKPAPEPAPGTGTIDSEADLQQILAQRTYSRTHSGHENPPAQSLAAAAAAHGPSPVEPYISGWGKPEESAMAPPHSGGYEIPEPDDIPRRSGSARGMRRDHAYDGEWPVSLLWSVASFFLLMVLAAQAVYFYRNDIADAMPAAKPLLDQYCKLLGCTVQSPLRPELLNIESSGMGLKIQDSSKIIPNAMVRNHAPRPQAFPSFEAALTDIRDQPAANRVFSPGA